MMNAMWNSLCGEQSVGFCSVIMRKSLILPALSEFRVTYWGVMVGLGVDQLGLAHAKKLRAGLFGDKLGEALHGPDPASAATRRRPQNLQSSVENNDFMIVDLHSSPGQLLP